jgi:hypothetical protein
MIAIHSHGNDPGMEIIQRVWPQDNPFVHNRHDLLKAVKQDLGSAGRDLNFNAYSDQRSIFRYDMHTLPSEISSSIGTSTLLAAWNAAIYVAQVEETGCSSKPCFFEPRQACRGVTCPSDLARGSRSTTGSRTGRRRAIGS